MIKHLYIKNFVLIDELSLDFENGFSAFTGETGAGKSILIDAISLLGRERASTAQIRHGETRAIVEGTFDLSHDSHALEVLTEAGFEVDLEEVTFTRELSASGKSTARIDHRIVTIGLLNDVLQNQIDIHNQRDNQYLLNARTHIDLLDEYLGCGDLRQKTAEAYAVWQAAVREKEKALQDTYNESDLEYFQYQIKEIDSARLKPGEDEELEERERAYKAVKNSYDRIHGILELYDSMSETLYEFRRQTDTLENTEVFEKIRERINDSYYQMEDAAADLRGVFEEFDFSDDDINALEERLFVLQRLKRKYGGSIEQILNKKTELQQAVDRIANRQTWLDQKDREIAAAYAEYRKAAEKLSEKRKKDSGKLDKEIAGHLKDLSLPNARFMTEIRPGTDSAKGFDHVEFLVNMNRGEELRPLVKVASGGEISRLMLGLKVIFTKLQKIETVIFDEIDTGVSGAVAGAIGQKMKELSGSCQVFAVTHLAPVAACADFNYVVEKDPDSEHVQTRVRQLDEAGTVSQLASILSGEVTEASLAAAAELRKRNRNS